MRKKVLTKDRQCGIIAGPRANAAALIQYIIYMGKSQAKMGKNFKKILFPGKYPETFSYMSVHRPKK